MSTEKICQLKITLMDVEPAIWRRIQVPGATLLPALHQIIQTSMGWKDSHLHQFIHKGTFYSAPDPWGEMDVEDHAETRIDQLLNKEKEKTLYEYDFGDGWRHEVMLEKILEADGKENYPVCIDGQNACPPEDCGGPWGYMELMEIMRDPKHKEYQSWKDWLGGDLSPEKFDKEEVNALL